MRQIRKEIELRQGVKVGMLFTPRLYSFKGHSGVTFDLNGDSIGDLYAAYADIMFCAALNLWTLEGKEIGEVDFTRADFHEWSVLNPQDFGKAFSFAFEAMTGKSLKEFTAEGKKGAETGGKPLKKKNRCGLITRLLNLFS